MSEVTWKDFARCLEADPDLFDPVSEPDPFQRALNTNAAKAICRTCLVREECFNSALVEDEKEMVWAGFTGEERAIIVRASNRWVKSHR